MNFTESQRKAIQATGNALVSAGAGTGKTRTLVERCLRLLEEGGSLERMLLVTFTEAAAAEMRQRIRLALEARAKSDSKWEEHVALLETSRISTLHSFCYQLIRNHFYELKLDPQPAVWEEGQMEPLRLECIGELVDRWFHASDPRFLRLARKWGGEKSVRAAMTRVHRFARAVPFSDSWLERQQQHFQEVSPALWHADLVASLPDWGRDWMEALSRQPRENSAAACSRVHLEKAIADQNAAGWRFAFERILDLDGPESWPRGTKTKFRTPIERLFEETSFLHSLLSESPDLPGKTGLEEDWELCRHDLVDLLSLTREFSTHFQNSKRELAALDYPDLEQFALQLLVDSESRAPTILALQWQEKLDHLFIDEYQDINPVQDQIIRALSRGGAGNRFLVGDVKQSIYRFRLANPEIFREYQQLWDQVIPLSENFRSRPGILQFVNSLFSRLMNERLPGPAYDSTAALTPGLDDAHPPGAGAPVEIHWLLQNSGADSSEGSDDLDGPGESAADAAELLAAEKEALLVGTRLKEIKTSGVPVWDERTKSLKPADWADMVILLRAISGRSEAFAKVFHQLGIPLLAPRGGFFEAQEIRDLLNLLRVLDNPLQEIPLAGVLRSPFGCFTLNEVGFLRSIYPTGPLWVALNRFHREMLKQPGATAGELQLEASTRDKARRLLQSVERWREMVRRISLASSLDRILAETGYDLVLLAGSRGNAAWANVQKLVELARRYDPGQRQGLFRFLQFIEDQDEIDREAAMPVEGHAVQLMSIHRSKGLEFPIVVLAGLSSRFNFSSAREDILIHERRGLAPRVYSEDGARKYSSAAHWLTRQEEELEIRSEELRLLYVAATRARDRLILAGLVTEKKWDEFRSLPEIESGRQPKRAGSYLEWIGEWLSLTSQFESQPGNRLAEFHLHGELPPLVSEPDAARVIGEIPSGITDRLSWIYPFRAATQEPAKTSISRIRQSHSDEGESRRWRMREARPADSPDAMQRGILHHRFLQWMSLEPLDEAEAWLAEARRLRDAGWFSEDELALLDFDQIRSFWAGPVAAQLRAHRNLVHRELPFTVRMARPDWETFSRDHADCDMRLHLEQDDFVLIQGFVDVAVIHPAEIWICDFKTDHLRPADLEKRTAHHAVQVDLYASALERIYKKPVTKKWICFLSMGQTVEIQPVPRPGR